MPITVKHSLDPRAVKRTWMFMLIAIALYAWPFALLPLGPRGWPGVIHLIGVNASNPAPLISWIAAVIVVVVFCAMAMRGYPLIREHLFDRGSMKTVAALFAAMSGIMEELWFRRLPMDYLQSRGANAFVQVVLTALLFGVAHAVWGVAARKMRVAIGSMVATTLLGAGLAIVYLLANRSIAPCIWAHFAINLILEPWLLVAAMTAGLASSDMKPTFS